MEVFVQTCRKVERVSSLIPQADVLCSFANERGEDWPELVPLVEFAKLLGLTTQLRLNSFTPTAAGYYS
jgi:hypothetical protein